MIVALLVLCQLTPPSLSLTSPQHNPSIHTLSSKHHSRQPLNLANPHPPTHLNTVAHTNSPQHPPTHTHFSTLTPTHSPQHTHTHTHTHLSTKTTTVVRARRGGMYPRMAIHVACIQGLMQRGKGRLVPRKFNIKLTINCIQ